MCSKMLWVLFAIVLTGVLIIVNGNHISICSNNDIIAQSDNDISNANRDPGSTTGQGHIAEDNEETINCCGILDRWKAKSSRSGTLWYQIWRPVAGTGNYELMFEFSDTFNNRETNSLTLTGADLRTILPGDRIGWWTSGQEMVRYQENWNTETVHYQTLGDFNPGDTTAWPGPNTYGNREYGIQLRVNRNDDPRFTNLQATTSHMDFDPAGTSVFTVSYTDDNVDDVSTLTIYMATNTYFDFNSATGLVTISSAGLHGVSTPQTLSFTVEDQCHNTDTKTLTVDIVNVPPSIDNLPSSTTISEDTNTQTSLYKVLVTDVDTVTCSIDSVTPSAGGSFQLIQEAPGWTIYTTAGSYFDYDVSQSHDVKIACTDTKDTTKADYTVNLIPNVPPSLDNLPSSTTLHEDTTTRVSLYTVQVTDTDSVTCTIESTTPNSGGPFSIAQEATGWGLYTTNGCSFDYDVATSHVLTIACADQRDTTRGDYTVNLIPNTPPSLDNLPNSTYLHEDTTTRVSLYTVQVTDTDSVTCTIESTTPNTGGPFTIAQETTGWGIYTSSACSFDYDVATSFVLTIACADQRDTTRGDYTVHIIPNAPPVLSNLPNSTSISEDTDTEILLYELVVTDPDDTVVSCSLGAGSAPASTSSMFRVRQKTGSSNWAIYTKAGASFDYDTQSDYKLDIECTDGRDTTNADFNVYLIRNEPPAFLNLPNSTVLSTDASIGDNMFTVLVNDPENDQVYFTITCDPLGCPLTIFESGEIQVSAGLITTTVVGYNIIVNVQDARRAADPKVLTVIIANINDSPVINNLDTSISLEENAGLGVELVTTSCTDADPGQQVSLSMSCVPASGATYFNIDSTSGSIRTSSISLIDYEMLALAATTSFACTVTCSDGLASDTAVLNIDVINQNEAPQFAQAGYSIVADEGPGGTVLQAGGFAVTDPDSGDTKTFSLDCGTETSSFTVVPSSGEVSYSTDYDVDAGTRPTSAACTITVTDSGGLTDTASLDITINNVNDNIPVFSPSFYSFFASIADPVSTVIGTVTATDGDVGNFGVLTFSLNQTALGNEYFGVSEAGDIYLKASTETIGEDSTVSFEVVATDGGTESRGYITVVITATTTLATTQTPNRYRTFFEDTKNIAWFTACCVTLLAIAVMGAFMILKYVGTRAAKPTTKFRFRCCKLKRETVPRRSYKLRSDTEQKPPARSPPMTPPKRQFQFWSTNGV